MVGGYLGYPPPSRPGQGTPLGWGNPPHQDLASIPPGMGYPHQDLAGVPPHQDLAWVPLPHPGMGYPPPRDGVHPHHQDLTGVPPTHPLVRAA